jgi:integrase
MNAKKLANPRAPQTDVLQVEIPVFSIIFRLGEVNGKIPVNPVGCVARKIENNSRERFLTADEETRLRTAIREKFPTHEPEFDLALYAGLRASELYNLRWENIDLFRGQLTSTELSGEVPASATTIQ